MQNHGKKMAGAILSAVAVVIYYAIFFFIVLDSIENPVAKVLLGIVPAILAIVMIAVCIQRIKEIKGGEEDDLSQY